MIAQRKTGVLFAFVAVLAAGAAHGAARLEDFPLGQSAKTGAVCEAVRDYEDPAAQARGAAAWAVRCRGWEGDLGHLYAYDQNGAGALGPKGLWRTALAARASCEADKALELKTLPAAHEAACVSAHGKAAYVAYGAERGGHAAAAEGLAPLADLLQAGLRIVAGVDKPPTKAVQTQAAATGGGAGAGGLAQAAETAQRSPERVRQQGYVQNQAWLFSDAEAAFRLLALDTASSPHDRGEAYLNWALNVSNLGRFSEADALFKAADAQVALAHEADLTAQALNYEALHARNQRNFKLAADLASRAMQIHRTGDEGPVGGAVELGQGSAGEIYISPAVAAALNTRAAARSFSRREMSAAQKQAVQDSQSLYVIGSSKAALGDDTGARSALDSAHNLLADAAVVNSAPWLRAQVDAELARLDLLAKNPAAAKLRLHEALEVLHRPGIAGALAGSQTEAALLLEYARAESANGDTAAALADFDRGFALFRESRGSLGASADAADAYFALLLKQRAAEPSKARAYDERFFTAAQSVVTEATADTVARLSARLSQGDSVSAGTARALEDTRRLVRIKQAEIKDLQDAGQYTGAVATQDDAKLKQLIADADNLQGQLLSVNPRYGQLVIGGATLADMQQALRPGETYVKIVLLSQRGYGLAITHDAVQPYVVDLSRSKADAMVSSLRHPFDAEGSLPRYDVAQAHALYGILFGPAQAQLAGAKHLVFDPDGALISFPVAALVPDQASVDLFAKRFADLRAKGGGVLTYADIKWLGRTIDTSLVVSASSFLQSRQFKPSEAAHAYLGFGDAITGSAANPKLFAAVLGKDTRGGSINSCEDTRVAMAGMRRLTETAVEVRSVGESLGAPPQDDVIGAAFTDDAIKARGDLDQYRVLYFATHGLLPQAGGCLPQPALVTSIGTGDSDALLDTSEILDLKLNADLVVLSACNTGGVGGQDGKTGLAGTGEALGGLTRAFIYAGSRSLIVSHWEVDSQSALTLMTTMFGTRGDDSQSDALRQAQVKMMDSARFSHPYYWAAFTVVGDGARPMPKPGA